ncbi:MAG: aspartate kinase [Planctomycetota bacterium]|jgi:aspartate kinase
MEIWKIGGSCLLGAPSYIRAAALAKDWGTPRLVVVSAMRGVTDELERLLQGSSTMPDEILAQHRDVWSALDGHEESFDHLANELRHDLQAAHDDFGLRRDCVLSWGDQFSARFLKQAFQRIGIEATYVDAGELGLVTNDSHGQAQPVLDVGKRIMAGLHQHSGLIVTPGFVGLSGSGQRTTLGRNTSDYTAALIAAASSSSTLRIFSSASGVLSADPNLVSTAHHLEELSYDETAELIHAGSPVLHPMALATMRQSGTQALLQSLTGDDSSVTSIVGIPSSNPDSFQAIPHRTGLALLEMHPKPGVKGIHLLGDCLRVLKDANIHVDMSSASDSTVQLAVVNRANIEELMVGFEEKAEIKIDGGYSSVSLVGRGVTRTPGIASQALGLLAKGHVFPRLMNDHGHAPCISFLLEDRFLAVAMQLLHEGIISAP